MHRYPAIRVRYGHRSTVLRCVSSYAMSSSRASVSGPEIGVFCYEVSGTDTAASYCRPMYCYAMSICCYALALRGPVLS
eukprot:382990-Rhodomonas_salina.2